MCFFWLRGRPDSRVVFLCPGHAPSTVLLLVEEGHSFLAHPAAGWMAPPCPALLEHPPEMSSLLLLLNLVTLQELFPTLAPSDLLCFQVLVLLFLE